MGSGPQFPQGRDNTFLGGGCLGPGEARPDRGREQQWGYKGFVSTSVSLKQTTHGKEKWTRVKVGLREAREEGSIMERPKASMFEQDSKFPCASPLAVWFGATHSTSLILSLLLYKIKVHYLLRMVVVKNKRDEKTGWHTAGSKRWGLRMRRPSFPEGHLGCWGQGRTQKKKGS